MRCYVLKKKQMCGVLFKDLMSINLDFVMQSSVSVNALPIINYCTNK